MRVLWIPLLVVALMGVACANYPVRSTTSDAQQVDESLTGKDRLYVEKPGALTVVNVATGAIERELPEGVLSPDRSRYYVVEGNAATSAVRTLDPASGGEVGRLTLPGAFRLPSSAYGPKDDALSSNGRFLVLAGTAAGSFAVIDLKNGKEHARLALGGPFTYDAIDDYGSSLYLLEHPQPGTDRYNVRLYDLGLGALAPRPIVDTKSASPSAADLARGTMGGIYHAAATAGLWHFGLYTSASGGPVVHALNMTSRYAFCLRTLSGDGAFKEAWSIVRSPTGDRVFAVNPASGKFASITAGSLEVADRSFSVKPGAVGGLRGGATISGDGARLYATGGRGILVVDAHGLSMKGQLLPDRRFASVMLSADGSRLYALGEDGSISRVEPGSGRDLGVVTRVSQAVSIVRVD